MGQYQTTKYHHFGDNHKYIKKILNKIETLDELKRDFIKDLYEYFPISDVSENDIDAYAHMADLNYQFSQQKKKDEIKIEIHNKIDYTCIQILIDDKPFIIDSIMEFIKSQSLAIYRNLYSVIKVKRDERGNLLEVSSKNIPHFNKECLIHIHTSLVSDNQAKELKQSITAILERVGLTVSDWQEMLKELDVYIENYDPKSKNQTEQERREFLENLRKSYFVFLGATKYEIKENVIKHKNDSHLGIVKLDHNIICPLIEATAFSEELLSGKFDIEIGNLNFVSVVHRSANLNYVAVRKYNKENNSLEVSVFVGLFTSILYYQSATLIPLIRSKLKAVLEKSGFKPGTHSGKEISSIVESLPRDELFQISTQSLLKMVVEIYALLKVPDVKLFMRTDKHGQFVNSIVLVPHLKANATTGCAINELFKNRYGKVITSIYTNFYGTKMGYYHVVAENSKNGSTDIKAIEEFEQEIIHATATWEENLQKNLESKYYFNKFLFLYSKYSESFPESYKEEYPNAADSVLNDIESLEKLSVDDKTLFNLTLFDNKIRLKIFSKRELLLSHVMPMIQNMGFVVESEIVYKILVDQDELYIHDFGLETSDNNIESIEANKENIEQTLSDIFENKAPNDEYNTLVLKGALTGRQVDLLRAIGKYLYQIKIGYSKEYMGQVLTKYSKLSKLIIDLFYAMFNTATEVETRIKLIKSINKKIDEALAEISDSVEDKIIRRHVEITRFILRTNYFQKTENGKDKEYMSFKFDSEQIPGLPLPKPFKEIFVYSAKFEAIHLRFGRVARGGLRWSDRIEDFRTEVLGLARTQVIKNAVIVPTGSKGGFIVKNAEKMTREEFRNQGVECYKNFLRGLLDITDNIVEGKIVRPQNVICYDSEDPYLVVAADKGTATFSDVANSISKEYNFWMSDAFASGGSAGYDHKKMAITARGAWVSVARHFNEMNVNIQKDDFTVIGIGDMAGDVFGNGMLLSEHIKLIAAFNHMHIFIDPNPDATSSFVERKRLFEKPMSSWDDYDRSLLSEGGMIYSRLEKKLVLTPQIQKRFSISQKSLTPDELITYILKAKADLLWNGGIGTYVKAVNESNIDVGDKSNDNLRINGEDLKCLVIGEGGNLGFTQAGRIEYAMAGGRVNTDAIDNSAGVDCSDHEVNIKIALNNSVKSGKITLEERNKILEEMKDEVADLVLRDNRMQTLALSISEAQGHNLLSSQEKFIRILEEKGVLDRKFEYLPSKQDFVQYHIAKQGLTRPELSILLAYSKNEIYKELINSSLPDDPYYEKDLLFYFPSIMREKFRDEILSHPLRREIITAGLVNSMVNRVETFFAHMSAEDYGYKLCDIARAYTITRDVFDMRGIWDKIAALDGLVSKDTQVLLYIEVKKFIMRCTSWLIRNTPSILYVKETIENYKAGIKDLTKIIGTYLSGNSKKYFENKYNVFKKNKVPEELAKIIAMLRPISAAYNIVYVANHTLKPIEEVTKVYFEMNDRFNFEWLRMCSDKVLSESNWQRLSTKVYKGELYDIHRNIVLSIFELSKTEADYVNKWLELRDKQVARYDRLVAEIGEAKELEYPMLMLALNRLNALLF